MKDSLPEKNIWCYTGYLFDVDLVPGGRKYVQGTTDIILPLIDVLVDGPFVEGKKSLKLKWKGSSNQRVIDIKKTLASNRMILVD